MQAAGGQALGLDQRGLRVLCRTSRCGSSVCKLEPVSFLWQRGLWFRRQLLVRRVELRLGAPGCG